MKKIDRKSSRKLFLMERKNAINLRTCQWAWHIIRGKHSRSFKDLSMAGVNQPREEKKWSVKFAHLGPNTGFTCTLVLHHSVQSTPNCGRCWTPHECHQTKLHTLSFAQWFSTSNILWNLKVQKENQWTKGNNSAWQTKDATTKTWIAYGNSTWRASKYKACKLH